MQLQLYALPASGLSQGGPSFEQRKGSPETLTCLLQASGLLQGQRIEVRVNDTLKRWQEGSTQSFSWEQHEYTDEIHLNLRTDAAILASWRGLWKGSAIFHLGTLPVRVFFNGVEQTLAEAAAVIQRVDLSHDPFPYNGHEEVRVLPSDPDSPAKPSVVEIAEETRPRESETGDPGAYHEERLDQDQDAQHEEEMDQDEEEEEEEEMDQDEEEEEEEEMDQDEEDAYDDQEEAMPEGVFALEQAPLVLAEDVHGESAPLEEEAAIPSVGEEESVHHEDTSLAVSSSQQTDSPTQRTQQAQVGPPIGSVAVFHADSTDEQQTLEQLKALLGTMPKKTVIVDLRELSRTRQKEAYHPLSRAHLRADFGGRYWDRSQFITTIPRSVPDPQRTMGRRWERTVSDVDNPEGLAFLEKYVRDGYSMIVMDSIGRDEESARRAVVIALQERIPTLKDVSHP